MVTERRNYDRVQFGRGYIARVMAIDGTWQRDCHIGDVSDTGAKLRIRGAINAIDTQEFLLVLSPTGNAFRRCERIWLNGDEVGVRFLKEVSADGRPPAARAPAKAVRRRGGRRARK
ncbi:MAG TPA: PilZ domain-containing protein [Xanthobacteraceae bacterium]|nr:PilZ domain-containing protein [Xanthobacteraceae bacterium]